MTKRQPRWLLETTAGSITLIFKKVRLIQSNVSAAAGREFSWMSHGVMHF